MSARVRVRLRTPSPANLLPRGDLRVVPDAGSVLLPASLPGDVRPLGDEERAGDAGTLGVHLNAEVGWDVGGIAAIASHGRKNNTVCEFNAADLDRLKEGVNGRHGDLE